MAKHHHSKQCRNSIITNTLSMSLLWKVTRCYITYLLFLSSFQIIFQHFVGSFFQNMIKVYTSASPSNDVKANKPLYFLQLFHNNSSTILSINQVVLLSKEFSTYKSRNHKLIVILQQELSVYWSIQLIIQSSRGTSLGAMVAMATTGSKRTKTEQTPGE